MANPSNLARKLPLAFVVGLLVAAICIEPAEAYTPNSPEVREMVRKAKSVLTEGRTTQPGGAALIAMALLKTGEKVSHESVQYAIEVCRELAGEAGKRGVGINCYNEAIACMFLCELDAQKYNQEIHLLLQALLDRQRENGCWGYKPHTYDDTSQSQYGMLAFWAARVHGFEVPTENIERAMLWFMRVQDASGGWVYESQDPGGAVRVKQRDKVTLPMSAAGLGSVYIGGSLVGFSRLASAEKSEAWKQTPGGLPPALRPVGSESDDAAAEPSLVSFAAFQSTTKIGNAWFGKNQTFKFPKWTHYYMYGLERYRSFQEQIRGKREAEPAWYNDGVSFLQSTQEADGGWRSLQPRTADPMVDTAFAVLFLARSTQKSISKSLEEGRTRGGKELPKDLTNIKLVDGKVVDAVAEKLTIDQLLKELEGDKTNDIRSSLPSQLVLSDNLQQRAAQLARLRRMAMDGSYQGRLTAAKTLGRDRDLGNVPVLIFALSDPDHRVSRAARDGLRFISRKFDGFGLPDQPKRHEWQAAQAKWKAWYLSVRPGGAIIE